MNNHWHTNYRAEQEHQTVFRYFIFPHLDGFSVEDATQRGLECGQPLVVLPARGELPKAPVHSSNRSVTISALKPSDDGKGLIVRLLSLADRPQTNCLVWADPKPAILYLSDNSERPRQACDSSIEVPAHSLLTLKAEWSP